MQRILYYVESWGMGGIESFLMSTIRLLDSSHFKFDIFTVHDRTDCFDREIEKLGGRRFCVFPGKKPNQILRLVFGLIEFRRILILNKYDIVHVHTMNGMGFAYAWIAKRAGVPIRIVHSHNSDVGSSFKHIKRAISLLGRVMFSAAASSRIACSRAAGEYLFGKKPFKVIRNGIDVQKFSFDSNKRKHLRSELGIPVDQILIGNISRISQAKNPIFQLEVFKEYLKLDPTAKYLLSDCGDMLNEVEERIASLGLKDGVIRFSPTQDCEGYYSAMDALCFPSLFEGLPFILIEAQCAGLPICMSECVSREAIVTSCCEVLSLQQTPAEWAQQIYRVAGRRHSAEECVSALGLAGYNIELSVLSLIKIYESSNLERSDK